MQHGPHMHNGSMPSMKKAAFDVALKSKEKIAEGTMAFHFEKPAGFAFRAGQHSRVTLQHIPETIDGGNKRFMTLANTPQDTELVLAMRMTGSAFKNALNEMQIGQKVLIEILLNVPHGAFALHHDSNVPAVFIAGGIGIVPAYSMIKDWAERRLAHKLYLFYSNRRPEDASYLGELETLEKQNPNFKLIATMTESEKSGTSWPGSTGPIDRSLLTKYVEDVRSPIYYISGVSGMVSAMKKLILDSGVPEENVRSEEFDGFKMAHAGAVTMLPWKRHAVFIAIALAVLVIIVAHVGAANSLYQSGLLSLKNPLLYVMVGVILILVAFKFRYLRKFGHSAKKTI